MHWVGTDEFELGTKSRSECHWFSYVGLAELVDSNLEIEIGTGIVVTSC